MSTQTTTGPGYGTGALPRRRNGAGTAALVTGVVALVLAVLVIFFPIAAVLGIIAAVLGAVGMRRATRGEADNRGHAVAGLVTGLLALIIAVGMGVRIGTFINDHQGDLRKFWTCITSAPSETEQEDCGAQLARRLDDG
jgi:NADH:ubiquinone oxidoreductase subunit 6 (subunit J)